MSRPPDALAEMARWAQWIIWRAEWNAARQKYDKYPVDPATGLPCSALDPANWMTYEQADLYAGLMGLDIGFAFTESDPFAFVDVDSAWQGDRWSDIGQWVANQFQGAAFEVSHSGLGFHIFCKYTSVPPHSNKRSDLGLEFYTRDRFCAVTRRQLTGNSGTDGTAYLAGFAPHFPPRITADTADWTDEPHADWIGSDDDAVMIETLLRIKGGPKVFTGQATPRDLWHADPGPLGVSYPDEFGKGRPYDSSSADMALCMHLAWLLGKNCERVERVFGQSGLVRDKWTEREDYRRLTILHAVAQTHNVYQDPRQVADAVDTGSPEIAASVGAELKTGFQLLTVNEQLTHFAGCVYVIDRHQALLPDGQLLNGERFAIVKGGFVFQYDDQKTEGDAWKTFTRSQLVAFPKVRTTAFRPIDPPGTRYNEMDKPDPMGAESVNTYVPLTVESVAGDPSPFLNHLVLMYSNERDQEIILSNMASMVQNLGVKFQWVLLLQGAEGNGKTLISRCLEAAIGKRFSHWPRASDLGNKFNAWVDRKLFGAIEDIKDTPTGEILLALTPLITNIRIEIQGKGADQITGDNFANFVMTTNHTDALRVTVDSRRFCVLQSDQQHASDIEAAGMGGDYFPKLYGWLKNGGAAIVTHFLQNYQVAAEFDPAGSCQRAPVTSTSHRAVEASRSPLEQLIQEAISEGRKGFRGNWVSSVWLGVLCDGARGATYKRRAAALDALGYDTHPGLPEGRTLEPIMLDQGRHSVLFAKRGSIQCNLEGRAAVDAYVKAQGDLPAAGSSAVA